MKYALTFSFIVFCLFASANPTFEAETEKWLDSTFHANSIIWEDTKTELMSFAHLYFKKVKTLNEFIQELNEKSDKLDGEKPEEKTYPALKKFSAQSSNISMQLRDHIFNNVLAEKNYNTYCEMSPEASVFWACYRVKNQSDSYSGLTTKIIGLQSVISSINLQEKLAVLIFIPQLFASSDSRSDHSNNTELERQKVQVISCDFDTPKTAESEGVTNQEDTSEIEETEPCFFGGVGAMMRFLVHNIEYPEYSRENGESGTVYTSFIINQNGTISDICIVKSPSDLLSQEAIRVIGLMPAWIPGSQNGIPIRVRYSLPLRFSLS